MTGEARGKHKKQGGDVITNFYNVRIGHYNAASSASTESLKRTPKTAEDSTITPATPRAPRTSTP
eukprot:6327152-Amphidinium_carterae.1